MLFVHGDVYVVLQFPAIVVSPTAKKEVPPAGAKVHHLEEARIGAMSHSPCSDTSVISPARFTVLITDRILLTRNSSSHLTPQPSQCGWDTCIG